MTTATTSSCSRRPPARSGRERARGLPRVRRARRRGPPLAQPRARQPHRDWRPLDHRAKRTPQHVRVHGARDPPTPRSRPHLPGRRFRSPTRRALHLGARNGPRDDPTVRRDPVPSTNTQHPHIAARVRATWTQARHSSTERHATRSRTPRPSKQQTQNSRHAPGGFTAQPPTQITGHLLSPARRR